MTIQIINYFILTYPSLSKRIPESNTVAQRIFSNLSLVNSKSDPNMRCLLQASFLLSTTPVVMRSFQAMSTR